MGTAAVSRLVGGIVLPKSQRLRSRRDFRLVYGRGRSYVNPLLALHVRPTRNAECRVGFSVSKKLGGAVQRNRIKRRLREAVRVHSAKLRPGVDVILVGRGRLKEANFAATCDAVSDVLRRAKVVPVAAERPAERPAPRAAGCEQREQS